MSYFCPALSGIASGGVGLQSRPQTDLTASWHFASQVIEQHDGLRLQMTPAQKKPSAQVELIAAPVLQMSCEQVALSNPVGGRAVAVTSCPLTKICAVPSVSAVKV